VVVSPFTRPQVKADLQSLLLAMADDPAARDALASIGVERFVVIDDSAYGSARDLVGVIPTAIVQP
jgi:ABC-type phosphate/phosphonate transport system substrate-binding protein